MSEKIICMPYADDSGWMVCDFGAGEGEEILARTFPTFEEWKSWNEGRFPWQNPYCSLDSPFSPYPGQSELSWRKYRELSNNRRMSAEK